MHDWMMRNIAIPAHQAAASAEGNADGQAEMQTSHQTWEVPYPGAKARIRRTRDTNPDARSGAVDVRQSTAQQPHGHANPQEPSGAASSSAAGMIPRREEHVYITERTGRKYHKRRSCKGLNQADEIQRVGLAEAINRGKVPCNVCCT